MKQNATASFPFDMYGCASSEFGSTREIRLKAQNINRILIGILLYNTYALFN